MKPQKPLVSWYVLDSICVLLLICLVFDVTDGEILGKKNKVKVSNPSLEGHLYGSKNVTCVGCTYLMSIVSRYIEINEVQVERFIEHEVCKFFPSILQIPCDELVEKFGDAVIKGLNDHDGPDRICHDIDLCDNPQCRFLPDAKLDDIPVPKNLGSTANVQGWNPWDWLKDIIKRIVDEHIPVIDGDEDYFSIIDTLRGSNWRGRDCDDNNADIYPGRLTLPTDDPNIDWNCNGIKGVDPKSGLSYEELLCSNSAQYGLIALGDSATAKFRVPRQFVDASLINNQTYQNLIGLAEDEGDWPQYSWATAHLREPNLPINTSSGYQRLLKKNLCNHRDYQNIGLNGARMGDVDEKLEKTVARHPHDKPALVFLATIGNDICGPHPDLDHMTKPDDFRKSALSVLSKLDTILPEGSHVVMVGLITDDCHWNVLHNASYPVYPDKIKYEDFYGFLNCYSVNPCYQLMNHDKSVRDAARQRARDLNAVEEDIAATQSYNNFDVAMYSIPMENMVAEWVRSGGKNIEMFEPVDGFHPSSISYELFNEYLWPLMEKEHPDWFPVNPNNGRIRELFGSQGGY